MKVYIIKRTSTGIWKEFFLNFLVGVIVFIIGIYTCFDHLFWGVIVLIFAFKFFIYRLIDFLFIKEFIEIEKILYISFLGVNFKINPKRCFSVIEAYSFPSKSGTKYYYLELIRNDERWLYRIFKNKIKLYVEDGEIDLEGVAQKLFDLYGIKYLGIFDDWNGQGYTENKDFLMKNKGIIP